MINFQYFPRSNQIPDALLNLAHIFETHATEMDSTEHNLKSNDVLEIISTDLEQAGYLVEKGKKAQDILAVPVLYGLNNKPTKYFYADALHLQQRIVLEVEAGRALDNNQFLKDIFQASMMINVEYLAIAVRNVYRNSNDFEKIYKFLDTLYTSQRIILPLKGILLIGY